MTNHELIQFNRADLREIRKQIIKAVEAIDTQVDYLGNLTSEKFESEIPLDSIWSSHARATYEETLDNYANFIGASMQSLIETKLALLGLGREIQHFYTATMYNEQSAVENIIGDAMSSVRWVKDRII